MNIHKGTTGENFFILYKNVTQQGNKSSKKHTQFPCLSLLTVHRSLLK